MANGLAPDTLRGRSLDERPRRRPGQWLGLTAVAVAIAVATVTVPPLITPRHHGKPAPTPQAAAPAATVASVAPSVSSAAPATSGAATPAAFTPITVQAEDPRNTLTGGAATTDCRTCHGGGRVRYVCVSCQVIVRTTVPVAGPRTVTVVYEADGPRFLKVKINDTPARTWPVTGVGWDTPRSFQFTADLPAGPLRLSLFNDKSPAPDIDEVVVS